MCNLNPWQSCISFGSVVSEIVNHTNNQNPYPRPILFCYIFLHVYINWCDECLPYLWSTTKWKTFERKKKTKWKEINVHINKYMCCIWNFWSVFFKFYFGFFFSVCMKITLSNFVFVLFDFFSLLWSEWRDDDRSTIFIMRDDRYLIRWTSIYKSLNKLKISFIYGVQNSTECCVYAWNLYAVELFTLYTRKYCLQNERNVCVVDSVFHSFLCNDDALSHIHITKFYLYVTYTFCIYMQVAVNSQHDKV